METVIITGGSGLVGQALTRLLQERGYQVIIFSRKAALHAPAGIRYAQWNITQQTYDRDAIAQADYIVHLAGASVSDKRWTAARKQEITNSRIQSSALLYKALQETPNKVKKVISASATGFYGEFSGKPFTENDPPAGDFLGATCVSWEKEVQRIGELGKKVIIFRTGLVMSREGGALPEFLKPLRFGFATILGNGEQWVSWIHLQDLVRLYFNAIVNDRLQGVYNAVAPQPVPHRELILSMAKAAKGKSFMTTYVPAFALKLAMGEMSVEVLKSVKVSSQKIQDMGFVFSYPTVRDAMEQLFMA